MEKRRIGEDFKYVWAINWNGLPEDFSDATEIVLTASVYGKKTILERGIDYVIEGNLIIVDFTPRICTVSGIYNLELKYVKPSDGFIDGERRSAVDIDAVQIVEKSSQVTATGDITSTSEAAFGFQGLSAYEVWLKDNPDKTKEDYYAWLQKPATDAVSLIEDKIETLDTAIQQEEQRELAEGVRLSNEQSRVEAEALRVTTEALRATAEASRVSAETSRATAEAVRVQAENERETAETTRVSNENNRVTAEQARVNAEIVREQQEQARQANTATAITNAENAIADVNAAKDDYYNVVKPDIIAQGEYATAQGDYAKAQGDYAKEQGDYVAGLQVLNAVIYSETEYNEI